MQHYILFLKKIQLFIVVALLLPSHINAQQAPDAGQLLKELSKPLSQPSSLQPVKSIATSKPPISSKGPKLLVNGFYILGANIIKESELQKQLKPFINQDLSFGQLRALTLDLVGYYADKGYVARVILPPQDIKDGIITFKVIEGKRGNISVSHQGKQIDNSRVQGFIDQRLPAGSTMSLIRLGEAMNILNDQPGIQAKASMLSGKIEGHTDLVITAIEKPLIASSLVLSNQASRSTGQEQLQGAVYLNNPSGHFDAASLSVKVNEGSTYLRADYGIALGETGFRLGINASDLKYSVIQSSLNSLDPNGTAKTYGISASYPWAFREDFKLYVTSNIDHKTLIDNTSAGETSNRVVDTLKLGLSGFVKPGSLSFLKGGKTTFGISITSGDNFQKNNGALSIDSTTRQVDGKYSKLNYNLGHRRLINKSWSLSINLRGQLSNKNLNSTERFSLGGPYAVRSYPSGEASGDEGWILNANIRKNINQTLAGTVFLDAGGIKLNENTWNNWNANNLQLKNSYQLYGIGVGVDWRFMPNTVLLSSLAVPIGQNLGRDSNNNNTDGRDSEHAYLWLSVNARF